MNDYEMLRTIIAIVKAYRAGELSAGEAVEKIRQLNI
jgi:hypothetical protein